MNGRVERANKREIAPVPVALVAGAVTACAPGERPQAPNVIVVVFDTTRFDDWSTFGPTPGARAIIALSPRAIAEARSAGFSVPRMASATRVPTPCTVRSRRNHSRSRSEAKPNRRISCSRT